MGSRMLKLKATSRSIFKVGILLFFSIPQLGLSRVTPSSPNDHSVNTSMRKAANCTYLGAQVSAMIAGVHLQLAKEALEDGQLNQAAVSTLLGAKYADDSQKYLESTKDALTAVDNTSATTAKQNATLPGQISTSIKQNLAVLEKGEGDFKYVPKDKLVTIDDKTYKESDMISSASMVKAGFSQDFADETVERIQLVEKKVADVVGDPTKLAACKAEVFVDPSTTTTPGLTTSTAPNFASASPAATSANATSIILTPLDAAQAYSVNFNGEPIGVTSAKIFSTVTRRYADIANKGEFIETPTTSVASGPAVGK